MLPTGCNEIVSNIVNCRMCFVARRVRKKVNIKTKNEKIVETDMDIWYYTYKTQLLETGRNSAM